MKHRYSWSFGMAAAAAAFSLSSTLPSLTQAAQFTIQAAVPTQQGDGTMSPAAQRAMTRGALPKSAEEEAAHEGRPRTPRATFWPGGSDSCASSLIQG